MKIRKKALFSALQYGFYPTVILYLFMSFGMFSFVDSWNFLTGSGNGSSWLRVLIAIVELGVVIFLYSYYEAEEISKEKSEFEKNIDCNSDLTFKDVPSMREVQKLFHNGYGKQYQMHAYPGDEYILIKKK